VKILGVKTRWLGNTRANITRKIIRGFEKFSLEENEILPIIILVARDAHCSLENNLSGSSHELRN
jgi:hypothetical protein